MINAQCRSTPNNADQCWSLPINSSQSTLIGTDQDWSTLGSIKYLWSAFIGIDRHWAMIWGVWIIFQIWMRDMAKKLVMPSRQIKGMPKAIEHHVKSSCTCMKPHPPGTTTGNHCSTWCNPGDIIYSCRTGEDFRKGVWKRLKVTTKSSSLCGFCRHCRHVVTVVTFKIWSKGP